MQAIKTKYLPATNFKPSRIKAECEAGTITIPYDHALSVQEAYTKAVELLLIKLQWKPDFIHSGQLKDGSYVYVLEFTTLHTNKRLPEYLKPQA